MTCTLLGLGKRPCEWRTVEGGRGGANSGKSHPFFVSFEFFSMIFFENQLVVNEKNVFNNLRFSSPVFQIIEPRITLWNATNIS